VSDDQPITFGRAVAWYVYLVGGILITVLIFGTFALAIQQHWGPWQMNNSFSTNVHSQQYCVGQTAQINTFITDFTHTTDPQAQENDVTQIWNAYDSIPTDGSCKIASDIQTFLATHPRTWTP
jgi:hypothetical protein